MEQTNVPALKTDFLTKAKQLILAVPNMDLLMEGHYREIFETQTLEEFFVHFITAARRFVVNASVDRDTKFYIFFLLQYNMNLLCSSFSERPTNINLNVFSQFASESLIAASVSPTDTHSNITSSSDNCISDSSTNSASLVQAISSSSPTELKSVLEIVAPQSSSWIVDVDLSALPPDQLDQLNALLHDRL